MADIAEVASRKHALHLHANTSVIARAMGIPRRTLADHLDRAPDARQRLRIAKGRGTNWRTTEFYALYEAAAKEIKEEGGWPCTTTLSEKLGFRRKRVSKYLAQHPLLVRRIGYIGDHLGTSADRLRRAATTMRAAGIPVTRCGITEHSGVCYLTLQRVLRTYPSFAAELQIERAQYGTLCKKH